MQMTDSVTVHMDASADRVWDLLSDVTRIGEFSPETFEAKWTRGATGPAAGAYFKGHVRRNGIGPVYWTLCRVVTCEPGEEFTFTVLAGNREVNTWGYRIAPAGNGVDVTEFFQLAGNPLLKAYWGVLGRLRGRTNRNGMRTTLERIKAVVEHAA
ncbi:SRPBCC family protein [Nocardioides terrisoli]|uniref:SRPBCC family protein n=1 Tax=Nocardioides terrisoli TaxID=3388267 RepID=UPI00287BB74F|nr:SRPBCC family protein [Nocardioides marmorisolisilvae]